MTCDECGMTLCDHVVAIGHQETEIVNALQDKLSQAQRRVFDLQRMVDAHQLRLDDKREEEQEYAWLLGRMSMLLTSTANALKGPPADLHLHDWSDLPDRARHLVALLDAHRAC